MAHNVLEWVDSTSSLATVILTLIIWIKAEKSLFKNQREKEAETTRQYEDILRERILHSLTRADGHKDSGLQATMSFLRSKRISDDRVFEIAKETLLDWNVDPGAVSRLIGDWRKRWEAVQILGTNFKV